MGHNYQKPQQKIIQWYEKCGRKTLPWRNTTNIYHIYISEIMLQQTQVERVLSNFYPNFLKKFSTLQSIAKSNEDDIVAQWSGLGYYSRARNIYATAQLTNGILPTTKEELKKLPGIGEYTASAICSFGYNQSVGVVDTNISRVLKRFFGLFDEKGELVLKKGEQFVNTNAPKIHNLALMDIGSLLCTPNDPKCPLCPLEKWCIGKENPTKYTYKKKRVYEKLTLHLGIYKKDGKIALIRGEAKIYKNMLILPNIDPIDGKFMGQFNHAYTKYRICVNLYMIQDLDNKKIVWTKMDEIGNKPIASLTKKAIDLLD